MWNNNTVVIQNDTYCKLQDLASAVTRKMNQN